MTTDDHRANGKTGIDIRRYADDALQEYLHARPRLLLTMLDILETYEKRTGDTRHAATDRRH